jgi:hypothetical protein
MGQTSYSAVTTVIGDVVASTLPNVRKEIVDNIFKGRPYLAKMLSKGRKKADQGGFQINRTVQNATNGTTTSFDGWQQVPIVPQEGLTDTIWSWKNYAGNWAVAWTEERANSGSKQKIRDIAEAKKNQLESSFSEDINSDLLNPASFTAVGNSGKDLTPLTMLVSRSALTVGSIAESSNSWWANQRLKSISSNNTATAGSAHMKQMRNFYNTCGKNGDGFPDLLLGSQASYELYESILDSKVRYGSTEMANLGFETVMFKGAEFMWDQILPGSSANSAATVAYDSGSYAEENIFFLNTKYLYFTVDSGADFITTPAVKHDANGQYGTSGSMLARLEHICTCRRAQGALYGINDETITLTT